ncbi:hypothetical protein D3C83_56980 [compost metagenome]
MTRLALRAMIIPHECGPSGEIELYKASLKMELRTVTSWILPLEPHIDSVSSVTQLPVTWSNTML